LEQAVFHTGRREIDDIHGAAVVIAHGAGFVVSAMPKL